MATKINEQIGLLHRAQVAIIETLESSVDAHGSLLDSVKDLAAIGGMVVSAMEKINDRVSQLEHQVFQLGNNAANHLQEYHEKEI